MIVRIWFCNWSCCSHTRAGARQAATNWPDAEHGAPSSMGKGSHDPPLPGLAWLQAGLMCLFHGQIAKFQRHHALFFCRYCYQRVSPSGNAQIPCIHVLRKQNPCLHELNCVILILLQWIQWCQDHVVNSGL